MSIEDQLRGEFRSTPVPTLAGDLAGDVLGALRQRRRGRLVLAAIAAGTVAAVGVPLALLGGTGGGAAPVASGSPRVGPAEVRPVFPLPGGGPTAVHVYTITDPAGGNPVSYLLDTASGRYRRMPYPVVLSPDLGRLAVVGPARIGLADRADLLRRGTAAIRWLPLPPGSEPLWSPDGTALLSTSIDKANGVRLTAHRYDLATGQVRDTPINLAIIGSSVGWAADSRRYLALVRAGETGNTVEPGGLRYLDADGTPGPAIGAANGMVGGASAYSPSRRYLIVDGSQVQSARPLFVQILDVHTGRVVRTLPGLGVAGWAGEHTVIRLVPGTPAGPSGATLVATDLDTGQTTARVQAPGLVVPATAQLGSSTGVKEPKLGF